MGVYIVGFIVALILAAIVIGWVAYCLFIRERHKSEAYQYDIADLKHRNQVLSLNDDDEKEKEVTAGVIFLPSRHNIHNQPDDYEKRPDYPESPALVTPSTDRLIEILDDNGVETAHYKDGIYEVDGAPAAHHSDV